MGKPVGSWRRVATAARSRASEGSWIGPRNRKKVKERNEPPHRFSPRGLAGGCNKFQRLAGGAFLARQL